MTFVKRDIDKGFALFNTISDDLNTLCHYYSTSKDLERIKKGESLMTKLEWGNYDIYQMCKQLVEVLEKKHLACKCKYCGSLFLWEKDAIFCNRYMRGASCKKRYDDNQYFIKHKEEKRGKSRKLMQKLREKRKKEKNFRSVNP